MSDNLFRGPYDHEGRRSRNERRVGVLGTGGRVWPGDWVAILTKEMHA